jgi:hypothetical protein
MYERERERARERARERGQESSRAFMVTFTGSTVKRVQQNNSTVVTNTR